MDQEKENPYRILSITNIIENHTTKENVSIE